MARVVDYVTREKYNAALTDRDEQKDKGVSKAELAKINAKLNLLKNQRASQLNHPVHGPILRQLDGDVSPNTSSNSQDTSKNPNVGQQLAPVVQSTGNASATKELYDNADFMDKKELPAESWVTPGHHDHGDNIRFISDGLQHAVSLFSSHFNPDNDPNHPSADIINKANKELYNVDRHLDHHYYSHKRNDAQAASSYLNAAAVGVAKVADLLSKNGMTKAPVISSSNGDSDQRELRDMSDLAGIANRTSKNYAKNYANGNTSIAKSPSTFKSNTSMPLIGGPDPARLSTYEKNVQNQYTKQLTEAQENSEWNQRAQPAAQTFEATPWQPSPTRFVKLHTTGEGINYPVRKVDQFGRELTAGTSRTESVPPKSVNPEKFPLLPKELEETGAVDYTAARKYRKGYGRELAKAVSDVRAARNTVVGTKLSETPKRLIPDREVADSSKGTAKANIQKAIDYTAGKSLFVRPMGVRKGQTEAATQAVLLAHKHFNETNSRIENGYLHPETDPAARLPNHLKKLLGPHGIDFAVSSYPTSRANSANMKNENSDSEDTEKAPEFSSDMLEGAAKEAIGLDQPANQSPYSFRRGGRGGSMSAFKGE